MRLVISIIFNVNRFQNDVDWVKLITFINSRTKILVFWALNSSTRYHITIVAIVVLNIWGLILLNFLTSASSIELLLLLQHVVTTSISLSHNPDVPRKLL